MTSTLTTDQSKFIHSTEKIIFDTSEQVQQIKFWMELILMLFF